jgi:hypothetical protein
MITTNGQTNKEKLKRIVAFAEAEGWKAVAGENFATFRIRGGNLWLVTINSYGIMSLKPNNRRVLKSSDVEQIINKIKSIAK